LIFPKKVGDFRKGGEELIKMGKAGERDGWFSVEVDNNWRERGLFEESILSGGKGGEAGLDFFLKSEAHQ